MYRYERTVELPDMIAYAGATWDWHRLHYDTVYLAERGLAKPVVDGQVFGAYLAIALREWFPGSVLTELSFRFRSLVFAGETIRCLGTPADSAEKGATQGSSAEKGAAQEGSGKQGAAQEGPQDDGAAPSTRTLDLRVEVVGDGRIAVAPASATVRLR